MSFLDYPSWTCDWEICDIAVSTSERLAPMGKMEANQPRLVSEKLFQLDPNFMVKTEATIL